MKKVIWTKKFSKDVKRAKKRNLNLNSLGEAITILQNKEILPQKYKPHPLKGNYSGYMECHLESDWLLIWQVDDECIYLVRTGTHSDLFE